MMDRDSKRGVVRVKSWEEFKRLAIKFQPEAIAYNIEQGIPARELTSLRLIIPAGDAYYIFLDFPRDDRLRETGIQLHRDKYGNHYIRDEDVVNFVRKELNRKDLAVYSYWTI